MECARLSDAELLPLLREESEASREALRELERRHFRAVRTFAALCTVSEDSADELADNAWRRATAPPEGVRVGAVRPHALCSVIRTTADWAGTARRADLKDELVGWIQSYVAEGRGDSAADDFPRTSMAARAFGALPDQSQTVLWHHAVEFDGVARIDQLLGGGTDEVSVLERRARREFYNSYVRLHEEEIRDDECRTLHRTMLAYADQRPIETAAELLPHLERCEHCSQAVDDLGLMQVHCGALLAEALLPWGGPEYAAAGFPSASRGAGPSGADGDSRYAGAAAGATVASAAGGAGDQGRGERSYEGRLAGGLRELARRGIAGGAERLRQATTRTGLRTGVRGGPGGADAGPVGGADTRSAGGAGPRPGEGRRRHRTKRAAQSAAVVALCSLLAAVAYTGGFRSGSPQSSESPPARGTTQAPAPPPDAVPTTATATATSTVTATETAPPPPGGGDGSPGRSDAPPQAGGGLPAGAAVEWLFDQVDGATAVDTSANGILGTLFGDPLPALVGSALQFNGGQEVSSDGAVLDTRRSFSVSARVKLADKSGTQTVVSQDGNRYSAFALQYDAGEDAWSMGLRDSDGGDTETDVALSGSRPRTGIWTYLTGVYDDAENEIRLYVDGQLEDRSEHDGDWPANGSFAVGRALLEGRPAQGFSGTVDDVRAYGRALSGREARTLAGGG